MNLQQAIDTIHDIRECFTHVVAFLTETDRRFRDGSTVYIIGVYQGTLREYKRSWVISGVWDYEEALLWWRIFSNQQ